MAIVYQQQISASVDDLATVTTGSMTTTTGQSIFVAVQTTNQNDTISVTDSKGNTYTALAEMNMSSTGCTQLFYCLNATGGSAHTITATAVSNLGVALVAHVYSGLSAGELDRAEYNASNALSANQVTTTLASSTRTANQLVLGYTGSTAALAVLQSGDGTYSNLIKEDTFSSPLTISLGLMGKVVSSTGAYSTKFSTSDSTTVKWAMGVATFSDAQIPLPPSVTTTAASSIAKTTATLNGDITSAGTQSVTKRGFVYGTASNTQPANGTLPYATVLFSDNFNDNTISSSWSTFESASNTVSEVNNRIQITHAATSEYNTIIATSSYNLTGANSSAQIVDVGNQTIVSHEAVLGLRLSLANANDCIWITASNNNLAAWYRTGGSQFQVGSSIAYSSTNHAYWRIREQSGTIYFDTSADNITWTNRWTLANPFAVTALYPYLQSGCWQNEASSSYAYFDNLSVKTNAVDYPNSTEETGTYSTGTFNSAVTGLTKNATYYVRAFAYSSVAGYTYSATETSFTLLTSVPLIDAYSAFHSNFLDLTDGADTDPFDSGDQIQYTFPTATQPSLQFVSAASAEGATVTMPTHKAGDLIVVFAFRDGSTTPPTLATGYTNVGSNAGTACASIVGYVTATSDAMSVGTWTNASSVLVHVYRGQLQTGTPIINQGAQTGTGTTVSYSGIVTMTDPGNSWVVRFGGHTSINTTLETPPTGYTLRTNAVGTVAEVSGFDTNGAVSSSTLANVSVGGTSGNWIGKTIEILSAPTTVVNLPDGTYYYRVRVKDPMGSNTFSSWSETRSFTKGGGGGGTTGQIKTPTTPKPIKVLIGGTWTTKPVKRLVGGTWTATSY